MNRLDGLLKRSDLPDDIITVSPSQISLWYSCEWKWYLQKKQNYETFRQFSKPMDMGSMFHAFADTWLKRFPGRPVEALDSSELVDIMHQVQQKNDWHTYEAQLRLMTVFTVFLAYMRYSVMEETLIPLGTEVETFAPTGLVSVDGRPIFLHGIIDLVAENLRGEVGPVDHKTHTSRPWVQEEVIFDLQLFFYMLLLSDQGLFSSFGAINAIDLKVPPIPKRGPDAAYHAKLADSLSNPDRFSRFTVTHTAHSLEEFRKRIYSIIRRMHCTPGVEYLMRIDRNCNRCGFKEACEMTLRGEEAVNFLESRFRTARIEVEDFDATEIVPADDQSFVLP